MVHTKALPSVNLNGQPGTGFMWDDPNCPYHKRIWMIWLKSAALSNLRVKSRALVVVHGTEDDVVPLQDSLDIFARANEPQELSKSRVRTMFQQ